MPSATPRRARLAVAALTLLVVAACMVLIPNPRLARVAAVSALSIGAVNYGLIALAARMSGKGE